MLHGAGVFRRALEEKFLLATELHRATCARGVPIEVITAPVLTIVPFCLRRNPGEQLNHWNQRNSDFLGRINERRRRYLSSTMLPANEGNIFTLCACVLSHRTHSQHVDNCVEDIREAAQLDGRNARCDAQ